MFKTILPGAWELTADFQLDLFTISVPTQWQQVAQFLAQQRVKTGKSKYPSIPVFSLEKILFGCFPGIIKFIPTAWKESGTDWLVAIEKIDLTYLPDFIKDWLMEEFSSSLGDSTVMSCLERLDNNAWHWNDRPFKFDSHHQPEKYPDFRYSVIPHYLTIKFLEQPIVIWDGNIERELTFYPVFHSSQSELMSWPPYQVESIDRNEKVTTAYISLVINFKLQTVPWRTKPLVYQQLSTRIWMTESLTPPRGRKMSILIGDRRRWLDGSYQPFSFNYLQLQSVGEGLKYPKPIENLFLTNDCQLPDPNALISQPNYHWSRFGAEPMELQIGVAYNSQYHGEAAWGKGVSPLDLASLDRAIQARLPLQRVGRGIRVPGKIPTFWPPAPVKSKTDSTPKDANDAKILMLRPNTAAPAVFSKDSYSIDSILIAWETAQCRDALIDRICQLLSLSATGESKIESAIESQWERRLYTGELGSVWILTQHIGDLTQRLDLKFDSVKGKSFQQRRVNALTERIDRIKSHLPPTQGLSGALVEIKPKDDFSPRESDPKLAWRIGGIRAGYLNQHIHAVTGTKKNKETYTKQDAQHRVERAVADLLRQFGVLPTPLISETELGAIGQNLWLTCCWVLRRTRKTTANNQANTVVLFLRVNPIVGTVEMTTSSLFSQHGWVSYAIGMIYLVNEHWDVDAYEGEDGGDSQGIWDRKHQEEALLNKFLTDCLRDCLSSSILAENPPYVLFMTEAQNARKLFPWLQNPNLPNHQLPPALNLTTAEADRLWMVRLRTHQQAEVPLTIVDNSPGSQTNGIFRWEDVCDANNYLYLSMRKLLTTEQNLLRKPESRFDAPNPSPNPKALEIALIHHPSIDRDNLAKFIHTLRERSPYFADFNALPFPFTLAINTKEYAVSAKDEIEDIISNEEIE
jgi:pPIWI_RE module N-terminal domain/RNaseH domain of pPIWI_RE/MID domain of pPIWI_RE